MKWKECELPAYRIRVVLVLVSTVVVCAPLFYAFLTPARIGTDHMGCDVLAFGWPFVFRQVLGELEVQANGLLAIDVAVAAIVLISAATVVWSIATGFSPRLQFRLGGLMVVIALAGAIFVSVPFPTGAPMTIPWVEYDAANARLEAKELIGPIAQTLRTYPVVVRFGIALGLASVPIWLVRVWLWIASKVSGPAPKGGRANESTVRSG